MVDYSTSLLPQKKRCLYCHKVFETKLNRQITCGDFECKRKHKTVKANPRAKHEWK